MGNAKRFLRRFSALVLTAALIVGLLPAYRFRSYAETAATVNVNMTICYDYAYEVLEYVNKERVKAGLCELEMDDTLVKAALQRCADSCVVGEAYDHSEIDDDVAHTRANGDSCFSICSKAFGENIAYGQQTPYSVMYNKSDDIDPYSSYDMDHSSWMRSIGHRKNILNQRWRSIGIAVVYFNGRYRFYWAQEFSPYYADSEDYRTDRVQTTMQVPVTAGVYNRLVNRGILDGSTISTGDEGGGSGGTTPVKGEWHNTGGRWWFELSDGSYLRNSWLKSNGKWFAFGDDGYMMTGWNFLEGNYYYFYGSGEMASGEWMSGFWLSGDGSWTYRQYGSWKADSYGWWYGDTSGWYACNQWQKIDGYWYYFDGWGYMVTNRYVDGYWVGADGVCQ